MGIQFTVIIFIYTILQIMFLSDLEEFRAQYINRASIIKLKKQLCSVKNNRLIKRDPYQNAIFHFTRSGRITKTYHIRNNEIQNRLYVYKNNQIKKIIESSKTTNLPSFISEFEYNKKGKIKKETCCHFFDSELSYIELSLHKYKGNLEIINQFSTSGIDDAYHILRHYNDSGFVIEEKAIRNNDDFVYWHRHEYLGESFITNTTEYNEDGSLYYPSGIYVPEFKWETKKEFDNHGNWVRKIRYKNDEPWEITERTIEYY